jgi:hypothetical protein
MNAKRKILFTLVSVIMVVTVCAAFVVVIDTSFNVFGFIKKYKTNKELDAYTSRAAKSLERIPDFKGVDKEAYLKENRDVAVMKSFKSFDEWLSFRTLKPTIGGKYIRTNDFGLRSASYSLAEMGLKAVENKKTVSRTLFC